jgi:hypothetical protein
MVDGGGKIKGAPVPLPTTSTVEGPKEKSRTQGPAKALVKSPADHFERSISKPGARQVPTLLNEASGRTDLLRMAKDNPEGLKRLLTTMLKQQQTGLTKFEAEMAGMRALLENLARERFKKKAMSEKGREMLKRRQSLKSMKSRLHMGRRKMSLLSKLATAMGKAELSEAVDDLLARYGRLSRDWEKRRLSLEVAEYVYAEPDETAEHLQHVLRAKVMSGHRGQVAGDVMHEVVPTRVISELIARTLDGSTNARDVELEPEGSKGQLGETLEHWTAVRRMFLDTLRHDPFAPGEQD